MRSMAFVILAFGAIVLSGCSAEPGQPRPACALEAARICMAAAETRFSAGVRSVGDADTALRTIGNQSRAREAQVVPYVVPVLQPDGTLAAEVDCYVNTDFHTFSIVRSDVAIAPESRGAVDFLLEEHLCTDEDAGLVARL